MASCVVFAGSGLSGRFLSLSWQWFFAIGGIADHASKNLSLQPNTRTACASVCCSSGRLSSGPTRPFTRDQRFWRLSLLQ